MRRFRAFTLIEILVVVLIMGIASAITIPYMGTTTDQKVASASRKITADLLYAQNEAISLQKMYYVQFDQTGNTYSVLSAPSTIVTHPVTKNPFTVTFGASGNSGLPDCSLGTISFDGANTLAFDWLGAPYSVTNGVVAPLSLGSIVIKCGTVTQTVSVDAITGQVEVH